MNNTTRGIAMLACAAGNIFVGIHNYRKLKAGGEEKTTTGRMVIGTSVVGAVCGIAAGIAALTRK